MTYSLAKYLTPDGAWFLVFDTADQAYAEAPHLLDSCPDVDAVLIWPASHTAEASNRPDNWAILYARDLIWPNYLVLGPKGYDARAALDGSNGA